MATGDVAQPSAADLDSVTLAVSAMVENRREFFQLLKLLEGGGDEIDVGTLTGIIDSEYADRTSIKPEEARAILRAARDG